MLLLLLLSAAAAVPGDVKVPAIFSDHAVLQKSSATAVFGMASPGEKVTVSYGGISASGAADKNGRFLVRLDLSKCDGSSRDLVFKAGNTVISKDVITGDVWLCAGQSNMRFIMRSVLNAEEEIRNSGNDRIRNFVVKNPQPFASGNAGAKSAMFAVGSWQKASPENTASFSAAGYFINSAC